MLNMLNLKIYRKLLVLCLLSVGLFIAASANLDRASAVPCCSSCEPAYDACVADCAYHYPQNPARYAQCVSLNCDPSYNWCLSNCSDGC